MVGAPLDLGVVRGLRVFIFKCPVCGRAVEVKESEVGKRFYRLHRHKVFCSCGYSGDAQVVGVKD